MEPQPEKLGLTADGGLEIVWSDGERRRYTVRELRENCPCASCIEKRMAPQPASLFPILSPEETQPLAIAKMEPTGHYAYSIHFSDGHDTGIYTLETLHRLGERVESSE